MKLLERLFSFLKSQKPITINESPLQFSETAINQIKQHLDNRPINIKSAFKVSILYKKEKFICQVGFEDFKMIRKTLFEYPVPLIISEKDELFLKGSIIDFHSDEKAYFHYPNFHLEVKTRANESIFIFYFDRYIISPDSPTKSFALDKSNVLDSYPYLIQEIFRTNLVESIYIEKNFISIEKTKEISKDDFESRIADVLISYFEKCGYSLYITNSEIKEKEFANK